MKPTGLATNQRPWATAGSLGPGGSVMAISSLRLEDGARETAELAAQAVARRPRAEDARPEQRLLRRLVDDRCDERVRHDEDRDLGVDLRVGDELAQDVAAERLELGEHRVDLTVQLPR